MGMTAKWDNAHESSLQSTGCYTSTNYLYVKLLEEHSIAVNSFFFSELYSSAKTNYNQRDA